ncbi:hypothetical protein F0562_030374 [Nyssa sinensis]|uniref:PB1 domain-containing protein n=1 Tax=Nyssa sinensis TaxID=561372 RepID=A0A5J5B2K9_9ASTE|nr:hypothetical protein F0562_030374 [Nyssa sinensis]
MPAMLVGGSALGAVFDEILKAERDLMETWVPSLRTPCNHIQQHRHAPFLLSSLLYCKISRPSRIIFWGCVLLGSVLMLRNMRGKKDFKIMEEFRKQYKEKHPDNKSVSVVGKAGGDKWKSLSEALQSFPRVAISAKTLREMAEDTKGKRNENEKVNNLVAKIRDVAFEAENIVDLFVLDVVSESVFYMRLMYSSGGKILPQPHDNQLIYVGGDTHIVDVYCLISFSSLFSSLSDIFDTTNFVIKYKLPIEDIEALIPVTTDEDIDDLMKAYHCFAGSNIHSNSKTAWFRLFLFSTEADSRAISNSNPVSIVSQLLDISDRQPRDPELKIPRWRIEIPDLSDEYVLKQVFRPFLYLTGVLEEIGSIKTEMVEISGNKLYGVRVPEVKTFSHENCSRTSAPNVEEETVVGFDHEVHTIKERLIGVSKQLEVISIVGMAGLGKTTLAKKLYNDPLVVYHFYIRRWTYVSQVFQKRDLLLGILSSFVQQENEIYRMSNEKLGERLYKCLKGRRYLVVMDDIWHIEAWNDTKMYFPNDNNGSRILFTSRIIDVASRAKPDSPPHFLHFLTDDESWDLLQKKVFQKTSCPTELVEIGKQIAKKCRGLPLAIVVVAGLLAKTEQTESWWKKVAQSVSSYILEDFRRPQAIHGHTSTELQPLASSLEIMLYLYGCIPRRL